MHSSRLPDGVGGVVAAAASLPHFAIFCTSKWLQPVARSRWYMLLKPLYILISTAPSQRLIMRLLVGWDRGALSSEVVEVGEGRLVKNVSASQQIL